MAQNKTLENEITEDLYQEASEEFLFKEPNMTEEF